MQLCLGTVQFGMNYGIQHAGQPALTDALNILDIAMQNGITAIDTAAAYGTAEEVVGTFIDKQENIREKFELISKLATTTLDDIPKEQYTETIRKSLLQSLKKLNTNYLDGYLLHNPADIYNDSVLSALVTLKKEGLVKQIGASVYTPEEAKKGIEQGLDILQIPFSVFDQRMDEQGIFDLALVNGVKLHARSIFTQGLMLMDEMDIPPHLESAKPIVKRLAGFCMKHSISSVQLAVSFVCMQSGVTHLVFGVDNKEQLLEIVDAYKHPIANSILEEAAHQFAGLDEEIIMPNLWKKT